MTSDSEDGLTMDLMTQHFVRQLKDMTLIDYNGRERPLLDFLLPYLNKVAEEGSSMESNANAEASQCRHKQLSGL